MTYGGKKVPDARHGGGELEMHRHFQRGRQSSPVWAVDSEQRDAIVEVRLCTETGRTLFVRWRATSIPRVARRRAGK